VRLATGHVGLDRGVLGRPEYAQPEGKPATAARGNGRPLVLLQTLKTHDPDELAGAFPRWDLRLRQLGGGSFRGELQFLQLGGTQIICASGNRRLQAQGSLPPGSFGFAPVLPRNPGAIWRGRRCRTGQVVTTSSEGGSVAAV